MNYVLPQSDQTLGHARDGIVCRAWLLLMLGVAKLQKAGLCQQHQLNMLCMVLINNADHSP